MQELILPHIQAADEDASTKSSGHGLQIPGGAPRTVLTEQHPPHKLHSLMNPTLPTTSLGAQGVLDSTRDILKYSVNTWDRGFLDKLYASPDAAGLASELLLATLNTNVHVYAVSPALVTIEKHTARELASLFGLRETNSGGVTIPGGAMSNTISMLIARNTMFPKIKTDGAAAAPKPLAVFTSAEAHYSISAAAAQLGLGSSSVRSVPVDAHGAMDAKEFARLVEEADVAGHKPFYVCATAGTTVRGAYDPFRGISEVCKKHGMWMHIDGCWGGPAIFSDKLKWKLDGSEMADSVAVNPHKMLGVPMTCSFLLGRDMRLFYKANSLEAGYLFHGDGPEDTAEGDKDEGRTEDEGFKGVPSWDEVHDLAALTPQCGRRADSLKMYMAWRYHGSEGFAGQVERAFEAAKELAEALEKETAVKLISDCPPPCCQVCFYYVGTGAKMDSKQTSRVTRGVVQALVRKGWMIDYSKGDEGEFMRAVCNRGTGSGIVQGLVKAINEVGEEVVSRSK